MLFFLQSADHQPAPSPARVAIVSAIIGEAHERCWRTLSAASWVRYAERIGADIVVYKERLDASDVARAPAWQKMLILEPSWTKRYDRIIWLDSDIIVADDAPDILKHAGPPEKIGVCIDSGRLSPVEGQIYLERLNNVKLSPAAFRTTWARAQQEIYILNDLPPHDFNYNTGVMVLSPHHHAELLSGIYRAPQVTGLAEQPHFSHALIERDLAHVLSPRFNWGVVETIQSLVHGDPIGEDEEMLGKIVHFLVRAELRNAYFLHFYGARALMEHYVDQVEKAAA